MSKERRIDITLSALENLFNLLLHERHVKEEHRDSFRVETPPKVIDYHDKNVVIGPILSRALITISYVEKGIRYYKEVAYFRTIPYGKFDLPVGLFYTFNYTEEAIREALSKIVVASEIIIDDKLIESLRTGTYAYLHAKKDSIIYCGTCKVILYQLESAEEVVTIYPVLGGYGGVLS